MWFIFFISIVGSCFIDPDSSDRVFLLTFYIVFYSINYSIKKRSHKYWTALFIICEIGHWPWWPCLFLDGFIAFLSKCIYDFSSPVFDDDLTSCFFVLQLIYFIFSFVHKLIQRFILFVCSCFCLLISCKSS